MCGNCLILSQEELDLIAADCGGMCTRCHRPDLVGGHAGDQGHSRLHTCSAILAPCRDLMARHWSSIWKIAPAAFLVMRSRSTSIRARGRAFKAAAKGKRGVTAWVERPGSLRIGHKLRLHVPDQRAWIHRIGAYGFLSETRVAVSDDSSGENVAIQSRARLIAR